MKTSATQTITNLRQKIITGLTPIITSDYILLDCPYHYNIGDTLIWKGEISYLSSLPYRCLGQSSMYTFDQRMKIGRETTILLHGGGNFGDIWKGHSDFRKRIVETYPDNPIVVLPQTVHYTDKEKMRADARIFSRHRNLVLCARDQRSYQLLKENFGNEVLLLPDMAFCIDPAELKKYEVPTAGQTLFLKRTDKELAGNDYREVPVGAVDSDWPGSNLRSVDGLIFKLLRGASLATRPKNGSNPLFRSLSAATDRFASGTFMDHAVREGVRFISRYEQVYTTRLHGAILSLLLNRQCYLYDNNYGKNSRFFHTWLEDTDSIELITGKE